MKRRGDAAAHQATAGARGSGRGRSSGLTLLEVLVALTVMTIGLLVLLAGFSEGGRALRSAALYTRAVFLGEQQLDKVLAEGTPEEGTQEGGWEEAPLYRWRMEVRPWRREGEEEGDLGRLREVRLVTIWADGPAQRTFEVSTIVPAEPGNEVAATP